MSADPPFYTDVPPHPAPIVAHVPHGGTAIPAHVRAEILLDDDALHAELVRMTDWHTAELWDWIASVGATRFVNGLSRLVVDPERFPDDAREPMARVGQGAVYVRTTDGGPLRDGSPGQRAALLERYFHPYHRALTETVAATVARFDRCLIVDCHSFGSTPLPSEPDQDPDRPEFCIGTDAFHTPSDLVEALARALRAQGHSVAIDRPFSGALVPLAWYRQDLRVRAIMLETRRDRYCDERTGAPLERFAATRATIRDAVTEALRETGWLAR
jgi:N-formylglutamate amidohydrolase